MWRDGVMQALPMLPGAVGGEAIAVSADGNIIAGTVTVGTSSVAFLYTPSTGMLNLNDLYASLLPAGSALRVVYGDVAQWALSGRTRLQQPDHSQ